MYTTVYIKPICKVSWVTAYSSYVGREQNYIMVNHNFSSMVLHNPVTLIQIIATMPSEGETSLVSCQSLVWYDLDENLIQKFIKFVPLKGGCGDAIKCYLFVSSSVIIKSIKN